MRYLLLCILFCLPSCTLYQKLKDSADTGLKIVTMFKEGASDVKERYDAISAKFEVLVGHVTTMGSEVTAKISQYKKEIDTDGDGKMSMEELLAWLTGAGGIGGGLIHLFAKGKANRVASDTRNAASDERKSRTEDALADLIAKVNGRTG